MEQCFKIAIWMFVLIGSLQAAPVSKQLSTFSEPLSTFNSTNLGLCYLKDEVKCGSNVTFITPKNILPICYTTALKVFIEGLEQADRTCTDDNGRVISLLEVFPDVTLESTTSAQCVWNIQEHGQQFVGFLEGLESFQNKLKEANKLSV